MATTLDPRIAAALAIHKPVEAYTEIGLEVTWRNIVCADCGAPADASIGRVLPIREPYPCPTAIGLGVRDIYPETLTKAYFLWWQAQGLDEEAAATAAALEVGA